MDAKDMDDDCTGKLSHDLVELSNNRVQKYPSILESEASYPQIPSFFPPQASEKPRHRDAGFTKRNLNDMLGAGSNLIDSYRTATHKDSSRPTLADLLGLFAQNETRELDEVDIEDEYLDLDNPLDKYYLELQRRNSASVELTKTFTLGTYNTEAFEKEPSEFDVLNIEVEEKTLGFWNGIYNRIILHMFGGILFLRLGLLFGVAGVPIALVIITLCACISIVTSVSLGAIASNGESFSGGVYFLISRSLGPTIGGATGLLLSVSASVACALYLTSLAQALLSTIGFSFSSSWSTQILSILLIIPTYALLKLGFQWTNGAQTAFLITLVISILAILIAAFRSINENGSLIDDIVVSEFDKSDFSFIQLVGIFFPAFTGISAGATVAKDLKNPVRDLPLGTVAAAITAPIVYSILGIVLSAAVPRSELLSNALALADFSRAPPLIWVGIYTTTMSSALTTFYAGPRISRAVFRDGILPFSQDITQHLQIHELASLTIILLIIIISKPLDSGSLTPLDSIAPYVTCVLLLTYSVINFSCFAASWSESPGWRPAFHWYNHWVSLGGGVLSLAMMWAINVYATIAALIVGAILYRVISQRNANVNWGSAGDAVNLRSAIKALNSLSDIRRSIQSFRVNLLVLADDIFKKKQLLAFADNLQRGKGLLLVGIVTKPHKWHTESRRELCDLHRWSAGRVINERKLQREHIEGFVEEVFEYDFRRGCRTLMQLAGISILKANTLLIGFCELWERKDPVNYVSVIRDAFAMHFGVMIMRNWKMYTPKKRTNANIDVWWLFDDGGLTVLIPHILRISDQFEGAHLRIMTVSASGKDAGLVFGLLKKLRIDAEIKSIAVQVDRQGFFIPSDESKAKFHLRFPWYTASGSRSRETDQYIHLAELIELYSSDSATVFVSLPVPSLSVEPTTYMAWIDTISSQFPPIVLLRGNQHNVLSVDF